MSIPVMAAAVQPNLNAHHDVSHTPPATTQIPTQFAGTKFNPALENRVNTQNAGQVIPRDQSSFKLDKPATPNNYTQPKLPVIQAQKR